MKFVIRKPETRHLTDEELITELLRKYRTVEEMRTLEVIAFLMLKYTDVRCLAYVIEI